jgi:predicted CoA-substrate-specific enzyme activase
MIYKGLDIGSTTTKIVHLENHTIFYKKIEPTIKFIYKSKKNWKDYITTGYGRYSVSSLKSIPEIRAHVLGAFWQTRLKNFTILDIGGQDFKIIFVKDSAIIDFYTNDKCAAGTGRFLEKMSTVLDTDLDELSSYYSNPVILNSVCTVFAETELISKIMEGNSKQSLMAGVNWTIFEKVKPFLKRYKTENLIFTGGVAKSKALKEIIEQETGLNLIIPEEPQLNAAIGCAYYLEKLKKHEIAEKPENF